MTTTMHITRWSCRALLLLLGWSLTTPVNAGWQSPFELTCFRKRQPVTAYYIAPAPNPCCNSAPVVAQYVPPPQNVCTQYVPRTYYQQVTNYQAQTYTEPHTEYRTSYYYEPVTSYRYSYAYDPCNCSYATVATPQVSYALRAQTTPVTTHVQKTQLVPVTQYRQMTYYEPVTTVTPAPAPVVGPWTSTPPGSGSVAPIQQQQFMPPAGVQENRTPGAGVQENRTPTGATDSPLYRSYSNPPANGTGRAPVAQPLPSVTHRPDRVTSNNAGWKPITATLAKHAIPER